MANPYGWDEALEDRLYRGEASGDDLRMAITAYAQAVPNTALQAWSTLEWASMQLSYVGADAAPAEYQQVLDVLPQGYLPGDVDARVRTFAASRATNGDPDLWRAATRALAGLTSSLWTDVTRIFDPVVAAWKEGEAPNRAARDAAEAEARAAAEPPPWPTIDLPATLDECWEGVEGDAFRDFLRQNGMAAEVDFCLAVEQTYVPSPSWESALALLTTYLLPGADTPARVHEATVDELMTAIPAADDAGDLGEAPADLFAAAHGEIAEGMLPWYDHYKSLFAPPAGPDNAYQT